MHIGPWIQATFRELHITYRCNFGSSKYSISRLDVKDFIETLQNTKKMENVVGKFLNL